MYAKVNVPSKSFTIEDLPWLLLEMDKMHDLFDDPWFTSLWTLEEAYLKKDPRFIARDTDTAHIGTFEDLLIACASIHTATQTIIEIDGDDGEQRLRSRCASHLKRLLFIRRAGMPALCAQKPYVPVQRFNLRADALFARSNLWHHADI